MASHNQATKECETEQTLHYWLFPHGTQGKRIVDENALESLVSEYQAHVSSFTHSYIWHMDPFSLHVKMDSCPDESGELIGAHIGGTMIVADNIEDEWFVMFLLKELCKEFKGLVCRITDTDGEFVLIEAAQHLPTWVNPETAEQRVYLKDGQVHLIPHNNPLSQTTEVIPIMEAVSQVNISPSSTLASPEIQNAINFKISGYPVKIAKDQHLAHAYVPVGVAALLKEYPTLVAPCVRAFCRRDHLDNKTLRIMKHFPPEQRVVSAVKFSKALYAQFTAHAYQPDARTGWRLPAPTHPSHPSHLLGIKLACGFEILVSSAGGVSPTTPTDEMDRNESSTLDLVVNNPRWDKYLKSLSEKGYFRGEMEGSKLHTELERNARHFFVANVLTSNKGDPNADELSIGAAVVKLLTKVNVDYAYYKQLEAKLPPQDDESWLEITPESLDEFLECEYGSGPYNAPKATSEKEMMASLSNFFKQSSDVSGVEIPSELQTSPAPIAPPRKASRKSSNSARKVSDFLVPNEQLRKISSQSNTSNASDMSSFSNKMNFNSEAFTDALNNILEFNLPEDEYFNPSDEESSGMSSYEDDDNDISLSRKTSNGSSNSKASSGVQPDLVGYMKQMENELRKTTIGDNFAKPKIPLAHLDDEFEDLDDLDVSQEMLQELMKTYTEQNGAPGPASTLLGSLGMKPPQS